MNSRQRAGHPARVQVSGSLAPYAEGFRQDLAAKGYHPQVIGRQVGLMADLSRWLEVQRLSADALVPAVVQEYLRARRAAGFRDLVPVLAVTPLWGICAALAPRPQPKRRFRLRRWISCWRSSPATWCMSVAFRPGR